MIVKSSSIPKELVEKIKKPDALDGEDILIEDDNGVFIGAIIQPNAYRFFLEKVEEKEDLLDSAISEPYDHNAVSLDELLGENDERRIKNK